MLFNSYIFVLLFLPLCLVGYFTINHFKKYKLAMFFLFVMSMWFYAYNNIYYLFIILFSILFNYTCYRLIKQKKGKLFVTLGVCVDIGILMFFKYMDFFIENFNGVFKTDFNLLHIALPLGISFFTFQQISFLVDSYRGEVEDVDFLSYACFVSYFPQLIAGPIVSHDEILPQLKDTAKKKVNIENLTKGFYLFALGLAKKCLIANRFSGAVTYGYTTIDKQGTVGAIIVMLSYTVQIYFDFSGYCDMAIGIGKMMNIDIPVNFNSPYRALTITEFWERWHITLTRFFTKYVYIPLGGSRKGKVRTYINIMIVFILSGCWHGAGWQFIFWGFIHGVFMVITRMFKKFFDALHPAVNWLVTFLFVNVAWVFFRAPSFASALTLLRKVFSFNYNGFDETLTETFRFTEIKKVFSVLKLESMFPHSIMVTFLIVSFFLMVAGKNALERTEKFKPTVIKAFTTVFLLVWSICTFSGLQEFLYFNF